MMTEEKLYKKWFNYKPHIVNGKLVSYYNSDEIREIKDDNGNPVDIAIIFSGRNRGKSFDISAKAIADGYYHKRHFAYCRRWKTEVTATDVENYFTDKVEFIKDMTDGQRTQVSAFRGKIYLANIDEKTEKVVRHEVIGYYFDINKSREKKSQQFPTIYKILYEEVFTKDGYCPDEPNKVLDFISTLKRNKEGQFIAYLISNTVSRVNPYINDWSLSKMYNQKSGTIDLYKLETTETDIEGNIIYYNIACEYLADSKSETNSETRKNRLLNRETIKSTLSNKWDVANQYPIIRNKNITKYPMLYSCVIYVKGFKYLCRVFRVPSDILERYNYYVENGEELEEEATETMVVLYVERKTTPIKYNERVFTDTPYLSKNCSIGFTCLNKRDRAFMRLLRERMVFFSNNLIGNEFYETIKGFN